MSVGNNDTEQKVTNFTEASVRTECCIDNFICNVLYEIKYIITHIKVKSNSHTKLQSFVYHETPATLYELYIK